MVAPANQLEVEAVIQDIAEAVGDALAARCVILFGSRARGDYKDYSDVDLAVIMDQPPVPLGSQERIRLEAHGAAAAETVSGKFFRRIDVRLWTDPEYRLQKRSINHVAGRSWREGKVLYGSHETLPGEEEVSELDHARELLGMAHGQMETMGLLEIRAREEDFGFHAERVVELTLKAWIALRGGQYPLTHQLGILFGALEESGASGTERFRHLTSLTNYAVIYQYRELPVHSMDRRWVMDQVGQLVDHVSTLPEQAESA